MTNLRISGFSTDLKISRNRKGELVSGGYNEEVKWRFGEPVPTEIRQAVKREKLFELQNPHPPQENEYALIARDINTNHNLKYSIIAIASRVKEDGDRPTIGYLFFWLTHPKNENDLDGVGTLINWWQALECPQFKLQEDASWQEEGKIFEKKEVSIKKYSDPYKTSYLNGDSIESRLNINFVPLICLSSGQSIEEIQELGKFLFKEYNEPISWAWNVTRPQKPELFNILAFDNESNKARIEPSMQAKRELRSQQELSTETPHRQSSVTLGNSDYIRIKKALKEFAQRFDINNFQNILSNVCNELISVITADEVISNAIVDSTFRNHCDHKPRMIYESLLMIIVPKEQIIDSWKKYSFESRTQQQSPNNSSFFARNIRVSEQFKEDSVIINAECLFLYLNISYFFAKKNDDLALNKFYEKIYRIIDYLVTTDQNCASSLLNSFKILRERYNLAEEQYRCYSWDRFFDEYKFHLYRFLSNQKDNKAERNTKNLRYTRLISLHDQLISLRDRSKSIEEEVKILRKQLNDSEEEKRKLERKISNLTPREFEARTTPKYYDGSYVIPEIKSSLPTSNPNLRDPLTGDFQSANPVTLPEYSTSQKDQQQVRSELANLSSTIESLTAQHSAKRQEYQTVNESVEQQKKVLTAIADLFYKTNAHQLSAYFYQISQGSVPGHIYDSVSKSKECWLLPLTKKPEEESFTQKNNRWR